MASDRHIGANMRYGCYRCEWRRTSGTCSSAYVPASLHTRHTRLVNNERFGKAVVHERGCTHYQKHILNREDAA